MGTTLKAAVSAIILSMPPVKVDATINDDVRESNLAATDRASLLAFLEELTSQFREGPAATIQWLHDLSPEQHQEATRLIGTLGFIASCVQEADAESRDENGADENDPFSGPMPPELAGLLAAMLGTDVDEDDDSDF